MQSIDTMTLADLEMVLDWAAEEGWNPGLADAPAFLAADPEGFLFKRIDGAPVAAISVVNHSPEFSFLGLYICRPEFRGQGHGLDIWQAGLRHAGGRCVGLDGVPDQQPNYRKSGFEPAGKTVRYAGRLSLPQTMAARVVGPADVARLIDADNRMTGVDRTAFLQAWFQGGPDRWTMVLEQSSDAPAYGTIRRCRNGFKIGPLVAASKAEAKALLASLAKDCADSEVFVDVPETAPKMTEMMQGLAFQPVFETARMYLGPRPIGAAKPYYAVTTLELG